jgi:hypothetical protein
MRRLTLSARRWLAGSAGAVVVGALVMVPLVSTGASASMTGTSHLRLGHARPERPRPLRRGATTTTSFPVTKQVQEFSTGTGDFCEGASPCNGDVAAGGAGTIDRVHSGFSNGGTGNYAPFTKAYSGSWMAVITGTDVANQGLGCQNTTVEGCTGPYWLPGKGAALGVENVFPARGFTVSMDAYLSPSTAAPVGSIFDNDVGLNTNSGSYFSDDIVEACLVSPGTFALAFSNGSPGNCSGTTDVTTDGWYRYVWQFSNQGGDVYVTVSVYSDSGGADPTLTRVFTTGPLPVSGTATPVSDVGGPAYWWAPTEQFYGMPVANFAIQLGQHVTGYTP